jgi:GrpB-like predicted nucleotidyltransferase (UPF0157 family)
MEKITFSPYQLVPASFNPWRPIFIDVAEAVIAKLKHPDFEFLHFGSSSFKVAGKGIIDISMLYQPGSLELAVKYLNDFGFLRQHSQKPFPDTRPRKDIAIIYLGVTFQVHMHVIEKNSAEHQKQSHFKTYMLENPQARDEYESQKRRILEQGLSHQDDYGKAKSPFVKGILSKRAVPVTS